MIPVCYRGAEHRAFAEHIASVLDAPVVDRVTLPTTVTLYIRAEGERITLVRPDIQGHETTTALSPLDDPYFRARCEGKRGKEPLPRAFGKMLSSGARIADCTAGTGADGLLLAARGAHVDMYEREPVAVLFLAQTLADAKNDAGFAPVAARIRLISDDALTAAFTSDIPYDGCYIDPMFLKSGKAKTAKDMACLQQLADDRPDAAGGALLHAALQANIRRIVVKRPAKAAPLDNIVPQHMLENKTIRYDVYSFVAS